LATPGSNPMKMMSHCLTISSFESHTVISAGYSACSAALLSALRLETMIFFGLHVPSAPA
jgi:hypothetical protein